MRRAILALTMTAIVACRPAASDLSQEQEAAVVEAVSAANAAYWDAWRAADWDRGMAFYVDSPEFVWAAGGVAYFGLDELEAARPGFAHVASQTFTFRSTEIFVMAADAASVTATGTWTQTDTAGVTGPTREFAWTAIWVLRDGEWKTHLAHMSYPVRPGGM